MAVSEFTVFHQQSMFCAWRASSFQIINARKPYSCVDHLSEREQLPEQPTNSKTETALEQRPPGLYRDAVTAAWPNYASRT